MTANLDRDDLAEILKGGTARHPRTGFGIRIDDDVLAVVPPSLIADLLNYLRGKEVE